MTTTAIRNTDWAIVRDEATKSQVFKRGVDQVFYGDAITHVVADYAGPVDPRVRRLARPPN